jgi:DNA-binding SARP family transcriptional activator/TolB-like protein/Flp pilus assembly protein TadD
VIWLRLLGQIDLARDDAREADSLLRQPKHIALLAYLALPSPGTWHRRDVILSTFWPESDQTRARSSLRSALYTLRGHLPEGVIRSRGDDEISLDPALIDTDVASMAEDFESNRFSEALDKYEGELLSGVFIADSPAFEKWLDAERLHYSSVAKKSAFEFSRECELRGDIAGAIEAARRAYELDQNDEAAARRWIALLDRAGDRAQAFAVYERFRNHMSENFGIRPSAETVALMDAVRTRHEANSTETEAAASQPVLRPAQRRRRWFLAIGPVLVAAAAFVLFRPADNTADGSVSARSLVVLPMENASGDDNLNYVAAGIAEGVAQHLERMGGFRIRSAARSEWPRDIRTNLPLIGKEMRSATLLRTSLRKQGDSLEVHTEVVDAPSGGVRNVSMRRFTVNDIPDVESRVAADVAGSVFRRPVPELPRPIDRSIDPESYKLMLKGWHTMLSEANNPEKVHEYAARDFFTKAVTIDPLNARAWSGLSSVWASLALSSSIPLKEGTERAEAEALRAIAIDSLQGSAWANLGIARAMHENDLTIGVKLLAKAIKAEPSNPEIYLIESVLWRVAHRYDEARDAIRVARSLDPLSLLYLNQEAATEFCADRPAAALEIFETERRMNPGSILAVNGTIRSLALLGRYDEAISLWRNTARANADTATVRSLNGAHGASSYWALKHLDGSRKLSRLSPDATPRTTILAQFAAGDEDAAYRTIEATPASERPSLYRLGCYPGVDEYRRTPRFKAAADRIGYLKPH